MKNSGEKKKKKGAEEDTDQGKEDQLDETILKAQDMDDKLSGLTGKKKAEPERMLPPSTSVFLNQASGDGEVSDPAPPSLDEDREKKIVEKNPALDKTRNAGKANIDELDEDLIEDHKDFEKRPNAAKEAPPSPKPVERRPPRSTERAPPKRESPSAQQGAPLPKRPHRPGRAPPRSNVHSPTKFEPAVAGVADTNLKRCPQCGGFVNLAVSKSCFSCGYDIK